MRFVLVALLFVTSAVSAEVYRWTDANGTVHYSDAAPPKGTRATLLDIEAKPGQPAPDTHDCYTLRCQGERLEMRLARRDELDARYALQRAASAPAPYRGLDFRKYISIQRGMSEGQLLGVAGMPDLRTRDRYLHTYTYMPTPADPFVTTVTFIGGRVNEIERVRKF